MNVLLQLEMITTTVSSYDKHSKEKYISLASKGKNPVHFNAH